MGFSGRPGRGRSDLVKHSEFAVLCIECRFAKTKNAPMPANSASYVRANLDRISDAVDLFDFHVFARRIYFPQRNWPAAG